MAPTKRQLRFHADLRLAAEIDISNISHIAKGDAEDEFTFIYTNLGQSPESGYEIRVQPQEVRGYPDDTSFLAYTNQDVSQEVAQVLDNSIADTAGMKVVDMLIHLSRQLQLLVATQSNELDEDGDLKMTDTEEFDTDDDSTESVLSLDDSDVFGDVDAVGIEGSTLAKDDIAEPMDISPMAQQRFRRDLLSVSKAGFHTGKVCGFEKGAMSSICWISIRVDKLQLSKEAGEAWNLASSDYIILLIQYHDYYTSFEDAIKMPVHTCNMTFRLRKSSQKKPTYQQACAAFQLDQPHQRESDSLGLSCLWIGKSIESFMKLEFLSMLKLRYGYGVSWAQAKIMLRYQAKLGVRDTDSSINYEQSINNQERAQDAQLPSVLVHDHLLSEGEISLPLVTFQFALHYLVKCTDYCTICHLKTEGNSDALKPYVCNEPLCLYQYMNLGFGPSLEYEIINQPKVVDLLVSLCFASLSVIHGNVSLRDFPTGLNLRVPSIRREVFELPKNTDQNKTPSCYLKVKGGVLVDYTAVSFNAKYSTATIIDEGYGVKLYEGQWVIIAVPVPGIPGIHGTESVHQPNPKITLHHSRIQSKIGNLLMLDIISQHMMPDPQSINHTFVTVDVDKSSTPRPGYLVPYNDELDAIDEPEKAFSMSIILAALPSIEDMRSYLKSDPLQSLARWQRMPRAAVDLLRWIVASNRSYIVQVDGDDTDASLARPHEKISGVEGWCQFRFAQGSLESDALFNNVVKDVKKTPKTLLAWHGSALENWHSIIRQGLDYTTTMNGRAFGNGIYFSRSFDTSVAYSPSRSQIWPQSSLRIASVLSLNEVANLPEQFVSRSPHYVVQFCHWTRCRYIFVSSFDRRGAEHPVTPMSAGQSQAPEFVQDSSLTATGPGGSRLIVPKIAIPDAQEKHHVPAESAKDVSEANFESSDDEEDLRFLHEEQATEFRPGTLDYSSLPMLAPPSYATVPAQKALSSEIKKLHKVQSTTPLPELGWYIDFDKVNNLFQWIVEFHSFDPSLPLAQDMKKQGVTSIIVEVRFLSSFPISPPFVRVISPRFLPFAAGGGGHVTAGGAMCMELLTNTGWSPVSSMEGVLLQVRLAICTSQPPARLETTRTPSSLAPYSIWEAVSAYKRAALIHGWEVSKDLLDLHRE